MPSDPARKKKSTPREKVILEIKPDGTIVEMTAAEARKWRKSIKTTIRNKP